MTGRTRLAVAALVLLAVLGAVVLIAFAGNACPADAPGRPCPTAGVNRAIVVALAAATAGLAVAPLALLAEFARRRRIIFREPGGARRAAACWWPASWPRSAALRLGRRDLGPGGPLPDQRRGRDGVAGDPTLRPAVTARGGAGADIFGSQPGDEDLLAELYDLEHDDVVDDLPFLRGDDPAQRRSNPRPGVRLGAGVLGALLEGGASRVLGIDASPALLRRAEARIAGDPLLGAAARDGRIGLLLGDVRALGTLDIRERFDLALAVGVLPHLDGPEDALRLLGGVRSLLAAGEGGW